VIFQGKFKISELPALHILVAADDCCAERFECCAMHQKHKIEVEKKSLALAIHVRPSLRPTFTEPYARAVKKRKLQWSKVPMSA
jgi:hypothetical protein